MNDSREAEPEEGTGRSDPPKSSPHLRTSPAIWLSQTKQVVVAYSSGCSTAAATATTTTTKYVRQTPLENTAAYVDKNRSERQPSLRCTWYTSR